MELALYCPDTGFYEKDDDTVGRHGDFYTSVSVGPVFGELLAFQIDDWMIQSNGRCESPGHVTVPGSKASGEHDLRNEFLIIEAGAHTGRLAKDILNWLRRQRPEAFAQVEYWIVEPSIRRRQRQNETLKEFSQQVRWADSLTAAGRAAPRSTGVIVANELLDAMPVHRFGWNALRRVWFEWKNGVATDSDDADADAERKTKNQTLEDRKRCSRATREQTADLLSDLNETISISNDVNLYYC